MIRTVAKGLPTGSAGQDEDVATPQKNQVRGFSSWAEAYRNRREQQRGAWKATKNSLHITVCFGFGIPLLLAALGFQTVTLANGSYNSVLTIALVLIILADSFFLRAFRRGGLMVRCVSVLLMLPTIYIVVDFIRRSSSFFR